MAIVADIDKVTYLFIYFSLYNAVLNNAVGNDVVVRRVYRHISTLYKI